MEINIFYLGIISEKVGSATEKFHSNCNGGLESLKEELELKYPELQKASYRIAINNNLSEEKVVDGDEVALLPQFAGG